MRMENLLEMNEFVGTWVAWCGPHAHAAQHTLTTHMRCTNTHCAGQAAHKSTPSQEVHIYMETCLSSLDLTDGEQRHRRHSCMAACKRLRKMRGKSIRALRAISNEGFEDIECQTQ